MATGGGDPGDLNFRLDLVGLTLLDRYKVESLLGKGGMASVYRATDERLARTVVVKVPDPAFLAEEGFIERFALEIKSLTTLEHPHIVKVLDSGSTRGVPYAVLQFLGGGSLEGWMEKQGKLSTAEVLEWLPFMADALDFIHLQGVVHRDVKPGNILRDKDGHYFLADFGIAKALAAREGHGVTKTGMVPGSPEYMAPEAVQDVPLTAAYDQYALALTVYQALAGKLPFAGSTPLQTLVEKSLHKVKQIRELVPDLPIGTAGAVMRALQQDPAKRHATCTEFAQAFFAGLGIDEPTGSHPAPGKMSVVPNSRGGRATSGEGRGAANEWDAAAKALRDAPPAGLGAAEAAGVRPRRARGIAIVVMLFALLSASGWFFFLRDGRDRATMAKDLRYEAMLKGRQRNLDGAYEGILAALAMHDEEEGRALRDSIAASIGKKLDSVLTVDSPAEGAVVGAARVEVKGKVGDPSIRVEKVLLDGVPASLADGAFHGTVEARPDGPRKIDVVAVERHGFTAKKTVSVIVDANPPVLLVTSPAEGAVVPAHLVLLGSVKDETSATVTIGSVSAVMGRLESGHGQSWTAAIDAADTGSASLELRIEAKDAAGNVATVVRHVRVDGIAPKVAVTSPQADFETSDASIEVRGKVDDPDAFLSVDGEEAARSRDGTFARTVPLLSEGPRDLVVLARDAAGNETTTKIRVTRRAPSSIEIESPGDGAWVASRHVEVSLAIRGPAPVEVRVNGQLAKAVGTRWTASIDVEEGDAEIVVEAAARGGAPVRARRTIHVDTTPPVVRVTSPAGDDLASSAAEVLVRGTVAKTGCKVTVGGLTADVGPSGEFAVKVLLPREGENPIEVAACDRAGNEVKTVLVLVRDTTPPKVVLLDPAEGAALSAGDFVVSGSISDTRKCLVVVKVDGVFAGRWESPPGAATGLVPWQVKVVVGAATRIISLQAWDSLRNAALPVERHVTVAGGGATPGGTTTTVGVAVPRLVGKTASAARALLVSQGLMASPVIVPDLSTPALQVISQKIAAGTKVALGTAIVFRVSAPKSAVPAPDVVGMMQLVAEESLLVAGLMSTVVQVVDPKRRPAGTVIEQSPAAGEPVAPGMVVTLKVPKP